MANIFSFFMHYHRIEFAQEIWPHFEQIVWMEYWQCANSHVSNEMGAFSHTNCEKKDLSSSSPISPFREISFYLICDGIL